MYPKYNLGELHFCAHILHCIMYERKWDKVDEMVSIHNKYMTQYKFPSLNLSMSYWLLVHIYIYIYVCVCVYIYIEIFIDHQLNPVAFTVWQYGLIAFFSPKYSKLYGLFLWFLCTPSYIEPCGQFSQRIDIVCPLSECFTPLWEEPTDGFTAIIRYYVILSFLSWNSHIWDQNKEFHLNVEPNDVIWS